MGVDRHRDDPVTGSLSVSYCPGVPVSIRCAVPADFPPIASVVDDWWGRPISVNLTRLFLDHFHATSWVAEDDRGIAGFLVGFHSPSLDSVSYVHFVGVRPDQRRGGLARGLYERFTHSAREAGRTELRAITGPSNINSVRFHQRLGFRASEPVEDYDGPGKPMITFVKTLTA